MGKSECCEPAGPYLDRYEYKHCDENGDCTWEHAKTTKTLCN